MISFPILLDEKQKYLRDRVRLFPILPGVYLMKNSENVIIYVGKAKNIRRRVLSYFSRADRKKTAIMMKHVCDIDHIVTDSEYEALLLENNLIKEHTPTYNISLKDGKSYPVVRITKDSYPRVYKTRTMIHDDSDYYGPFTQVHLLNQCMEIIWKLFPLRRCRTRELVRRAHPCFYYHIKRCAGACAGKISHEAYIQRVEAIRKIFLGKTEILLDQLRGAMDLAQKELRFEQAALLRDGIQSIEDLQTEQHVHDFNSDDKDYVGIVLKNDQALVLIFRMVGGRLIEGGSYFFPSVFESEAEFLSQFIMRHYQSLSRLPHSIFTALRLTDRKYIETFFWEKRGLRCRVRMPTQKKDFRLVKMTIDNAWFRYYHHKERHNPLEDISELQNLLEFETPPTYIEGFDIAHIGGKHTVASLVVFRQGRPSPRDYRRFHIRSLKDGVIDDFASIKEAVTRRYMRLKNEDAPLPDLIFIDGGQGQLHKAEEALSLLDLGHIPLVALAKKHEDIFVPGRSHPLPRTDTNRGLHVLQAVRDEAHRFATTFRSQLQSGDLSFSFLLSVPGIGQKRAKDLMKNYPSLDQIRHVSIDFLSKSLSIPLEVVKSLKKKLKHLR